MKKQNLQLSLKKEVIANLNKIQAGQLVGGYDTVPSPTAVIAEAYSKSSVCCCVDLVQGIAKDLGVDFLTKACPDTDPLAIVRPFSGNLGCVTA